MTHVIPERHRTRQDELVGSSWDSLEGSSWEQKWWFSQIWYSLKLTANAPENRPGPKRKRESLPTIHVQGRSVSFREGIWCIFCWIDYVPVCLCALLWILLVANETTGTGMWVFPTIMLPKSSILIDLIGFSIINHPILGGKHPYFWKHPCIIYGLFTRIMHIGSIQKMQRYSPVNRCFFKIVVDFELVAMYRSRWWFQKFVIFTPYLGKI